jgi:hypothetical protein
MLRAYPAFKNIGKLCALRQRRIAHELNAMAVIVTNSAAMLRLLRSESHQGPTFRLFCAGNARDGRSLKGVDQRLDPGRG